MGCPAVHFVPVEIAIPDHTEPGDAHVLPAPGDGADVTGKPGSAQDDRNIVCIRFHRFLVPDSHMTKSCPRQMKKPAMMIFHAILRMIFLENVARLDFQIGEIH